MRHARRLSPLAPLLALSAACGGGDDAGSVPGWTRLEWRPVTARQDPADRSATVVATVGAAVVDSAWRIAERRHELALDVRGVPATLWLEGDGPRLASLPVALVASRVDGAVLRVDVPDGERDAVRLAFFTGDRTRAYSDIVVVDGEPGPESIELDLAKVRILEGDLDRVVLESSGEASELGFVDVTFVQKPPLAHLPTARSGPELLLVGEDGRRGIGLGVRDGVRTELDVPAGGKLEFSYRAGAAAANGDAVLVVEGLPGPARRLPLGDAAGPEWRTFTESPSGRTRGTLTLSIEGGGPRAHTYVADAGVLHDGGERDAPTVVLITSDTHRGRLVGTTAGGLVRTPALDALAARGLLFLDAASTSNATNPSHVALHTGLHPRDSRIVTNRDPVARRATTLAERFAAAGYRTAAAYSVLWLNDEMSGLGQGFDRYDGAGFATDLDADVFQLSAEEVRRGDRTVARALAQLDAARGAPLFLWVHLYDPHAPYVPPREFDGRYYPADRDPRADGPGLAIPEEFLPGFLSDVRDPEYPWSQYRALVDYVDHVLTPLLEHPRVAAGITAFTSDHGEAFGVQGIWWEHDGLYTATTRVPLVLAWPGAPVARPGAPVRQADVGYTLLEVAGLGAGDFPGRDLRWALDEEPAAQPRFALGVDAHSASIDDGRWLLVLHLHEEQNTERSRTWTPGEVELFDRRVDPDCATDLVERELERARRMRRALITWLAAADPEGYRGEFHINASIERALAELGYASGAAGEGAWRDPELGDAFIQRFGER